MALYLRADLNHGESPKSAKEENNKMPLRELSTSALGIL